MNRVSGVAWTEEHVRTVRQARLGTQRGGYHPDDVDRRLDHVVALMEAGRSVPSQIHGLRRVIALREGYSIAAVDALFGNIAEWQRRITAPQRAGTPRKKTQKAVRRRTVWTPQQMDWVREVQFRPARGRKGYAEEEVDAFLDEVLVCMTKGEELPDIDSVLFYPPRTGQSGYETLGVDRFLDDLKRLRPVVKETPIVRKR